MDPILQYKFVFLCFGFAAFFSLISVALVIHKKKTWMAISSVVMVGLAIFIGILMAADANEKLGYYKDMNLPRTEQNEEEGYTSESMNEAQEQEEKYEVILKSKTPIELKY